MHVTVNTTAGDALGACFHNEQVTPGKAALDAVLFDFNPSTNPKVTNIKALHAALIR